MVLLLAFADHSELVGGEWQQRASGGRLFAADGLFDLSYGPTDVVLLDGNIPHGVTNLRDLPGEGATARPQLTRFSGIMFSTFQRRLGCISMVIMMLCGVRATGLVLSGRSN